MWTLVTRTLPRNMHTPAWRLLVLARHVCHCKERYKEGLLWAGRGTIPVNELA